MPVAPSPAPIAPWMMAPAGPATGGGGRFGTGTVGIAVGVAAVVFGVVGAIVIPGVVGMFGIAVGVAAVAFGVVGAIVIPGIAGIDCFGNVTRFWT